MESISKRLRRRLSKNVDGLPTQADPSLPLPDGIKDLQTLMAGGMDPIHAAYAFMQQLSAHFAEGAADWPDLAEFAEVVWSAEDEYMPSGPPTSPLTASYFWTWALYDLQIGKAQETIASCQIDLNDLIMMNPDQLDAVKKLNASRMGIYEHIGTVNDKVRLRELLTEDEFICHCGSGYFGHQDELWYVRLLPPLMPEVASYHIVFTTPYVLMAGKHDWTNFLRRAMLPFKIKNQRKALHRLLKQGPSQDYWHEFVFKAYHHHQSDAVFLTGIPDVHDTLPHA